VKIKFCFLWEGLEFVKDIPREGSSISGLRVRGLGLRLGREFSPEVRFRGSGVREEKRE